MMPFRCETNAFSESKDSIGYQQVLQEVENYFITGTTNPSQKVCRTSLPPLYFQHPGRCLKNSLPFWRFTKRLLGHSMTIIGLERRKNGSSSLLVLDPMFKPSQGIVRLIGTRFQTNHPEQLMKAYRRGDSYLSRYKKFELLRYYILLLSPTPPFPQSWLNSSIRLTWRLPLKEGWDGLWSAFYSPSPPFSLNDRNLCLLTCHRKHKHNNTLELITRCHIFFKTMEGVGGTHN